jgi:sugar phosphate permease
MPVESASTTEAERVATASPARRWLLIATLAVVMFLVIGSTAMTIPIFMTPLAKHYGWNHARVSTLPTVFLLMLSVGAPIVGSLLDRLDARIVMAGGAAIAAAGLIRASRAHSYGPMAGAYVLLGAGAAGSTLVPCAVVAANWFADNRGLALGATVSLALALAAARSIHADSGERSTSALARSESTRAAYCRGSQEDAQLWETSEPLPPWRELPRLCGRDS